MVRTLIVTPTRKPSKQLNLKNDLQAQRLAGLRVLLAIAGVYVGLNGSFDWLRRITFLGTIKILELLKVNYEIINSYNLRVHNLDISIITECTSIAAALGAIPLFWRYKNDALLSALRVLKIFIVFELLNLIRIAFGLYFFDKGFSWNLSHVIPSSIFYFLWLRWTLIAGGWIRFEKRIVKFSLPESVKD